MKNIAHIQCTEKDLEAHCSTLKVLQHDLVHQSPVDSCLEQASMLARIFHNEYICSYHEPGLQMRHLLDIDLQSHDPIHGHSSRKTFPEELPDLNHYSGRVNPGTVEFKESIETKTYFTASISFARHTKLGMMRFQQRQVASNALLDLCRVCRDLHVFFNRRSTCRDKFAVLQFHKT
jgi:hypothetical protein